MTMLLPQRNLQQSQTVTGCYVYFQWGRALEETASYSITAERRVHKYLPSIIIPIKTDGSDTTEEG